MDDDYAESVLEVVRTIPAGRVMTYGLIAEVVLDRQAAAGLPARGGPRQVGQVLAHGGAEVPWWRVVDVSGRPPARLRVEALARLRVEGVGTGSGGDRVVVRAAIWWPDADSDLP